MPVKKTNDIFITQVKEQVGDEYTFLDDYVNTHYPLECIHNYCNRKWKISPNDFLRGHRCPYCVRENNGKQRRKTNEQFLREASAISKDYLFLDKYECAHKKIRCKHLKCGMIWKIAPHEFLKGVGCPKCKSSKGELKIENLLLSKNITDIKEKSFDWCYPKKYRYDFYIKSRNTIIEYHGRQHYEETSMCQTNLIDRQKDDNIKKNLAIRHGIRYIVIPYWDYDKIDDILYDF